MDDTNKNSEHIKKPTSLTSRLKTAIIALPILISMLYYKFLYTILMLSKI
jgi:hypothetical protein